MISSFYIITPSSTTITYDKNGNLIRESGRRNASYTFDADNRLTSVTIAPLIRGEREMPGMAFRRGGLVEPGVTSTYLYDSSGQRIYSKDVTMSSAGAILETRETYTISKTYSETYINGVLKTKNTHIFAGDLMLASVEYGGGSDAPLIKGELKGDLVIYHLSDHLGSTSVSTDASGSITELSDYYAYGSERQSVHSNTSPEKRKYIGQEYDISTGLNYLNARYYNSAIGRFISQDPVFWGDQNLLNPQSLNSYSYSNNNPVNLTDTTGLSAATFGQGLFWGAVKSVAFIAATTVAVTLVIGSAPISVPVAIALTVISAGSIAYSAYQNNRAFASGAITQDQYDYNNGELTSFGVATVVGASTIPKMGGVKAATTEVAVAETPKVVATTAKTAPTVNNSPDIIVDPGGQAFPVPKGAKGPTPSINSAGKKTGVAFTGGSGGSDGQVCTMRIMDPRPAIGKAPAYPNGYVSYANRIGQPLKSPYSGQTGNRTETHFPISSNK